MQKFYTTTTTTTTPFPLLFFLLLPLKPLTTAATTTATTTSTTHRRLLHHPFFPTLSPSPSPLPPPRALSHNLKHPFSLSSPPSTPTTTPTTNDNPFFPFYPSSPPPPPPPSLSLPTFPANISSLALPHTSTSPASHSPVSRKLTITLILLSLLTLSLILSLFVLLRRKSRGNSSHDPPRNPSKEYHNDPPQKKTPPAHVSNTSSEFLYFGTVANSCEFQPANEGPSSPPPEVYIKLCGGESPELKPLPPLPRSNRPSGFQENLENEELFFSPRGFHERESEHSGLKSCETSPGRVDSPARSSSGSDISVEIFELAQRTEHFQAAGKRAPPAPPPPPPVRVGNPGGGSGGFGGPPPLMPPSGPVGFRRSGERVSGEKEKEMAKTKLKALHWDKVRASSDRVMVWDQLHPGSFQLNEEMIETLFKANGPNMGAKDGARRSIMPLLNEETRVLDPKKSQNIAILLRALNVTVEEVCEALLEGNADTLGTELLESLLKMAPTNEEERKLREYKDESPMKLGPAEKFLKAVLEVPFAFQRVDAMLYMATFDSEVEYLKRSFETLEVACRELRDSRMFLKLLEAVLKTGNRMNVGTNRGDAQAFKLDTLLKLADIKGADGRTTLLHFVVQEIIKAEGSRLSNPTHESTSPKPRDQNSNIHDDIESRKRGLEVVSALGGELSSVKKAAAMDSDALSADVRKLARGIVKINEVLVLTKEEAGTTEASERFSESMEGFLKKAELEITKAQSQESCAFTRVKELTEYFHGNSAKEEAHPLRIFTVVRDFLCVLDRVCKEVGKVNERTFISSGRAFTVSANPALQPPFPELGTRQKGSSDDDDDESIAPT